MRGWCWGAICERRSGFVVGDEVDVQIAAWFEDKRQEARATGKLIAKVKTNGVLLLFR